MKKFTPYTLIEIMVVMALAAVLVTLALPAFSALMRGNSVGITCGMIKNTLDQAQARALTDRKLVATVFDLTGNVSGLTDMQAMRNCYVTETGANSYTFRSWVEESQWVELDQEAQILRAGTYSGSGQNANIPTSGGSVPSGFNTLATVNSVQDAGGTQNLPAVIFASYGNVVAPTQNFFIGVGEATLVNGSYLFKNTVSSGAPGNVMATTVNRFTGRSQIATINESGDIE